VSFLESAVLLAWVALVLLALGLAGLLRQVTVLTRGQAGRSGQSAPAAGSPRSTRDLVGFRLPAHGDLAGLVEPGAHRTVVAFVSPGCSSCAITLTGLAGVPDVREGSVALVAVSTGLLGSMNRAEIRAVLAHEVGHVANGDMVTMTLLQGVLNAAVFLLARVIGMVVDGALSSDNRRRGPGIGYHLTRIVMQMVLGILASMVVMAYSRRREYAADAIAAHYLGSPTDMIAALQRLGGLVPGQLPDSMKAFGIGSRGNLATLLSSHPPLEARIERLRNLPPAS